MSTSTLYLDTEFNGFGGQLISLALVPLEGPEWYEVLNVDEPLHPWVARHVMGVLEKQPISRMHFRQSLQVFLLDHKNAHIYADWPEDFMHLLSYLCESGGKMLAAEFTFHLVLSDKLFPEKPHNALSDARALMKWHRAKRSTGATGEVAP